jgi:hypothetical protein
MPEQDVLTPLEQAIEEFHRLKEDGRRLLEISRWPDVKTPAEVAPDLDEVPAVEVTVP